ncbi:uncharacterized protein [Arachis hypogaea]|uniref:uncharacterized protein n=1 Tax=Arachis hypogaea TaxID=3818 RepID=UPI003B21F991
MVRDLGLDYKKTYACPNDCMLYWKEHENEKYSHECGTSRWIEPAVVEGDISSKKAHNILAKTLWYFRQIPRLQRLFICSKTVKNMSWHQEKRKKDGKLKHPANGQTSPGNDIDVYLQPLIEELKELWELGVETYDAARNKTFQMHAALLWIISDFPPYAMLSGWSTKGKLACPSCNYGTCSSYLTHSQKMCYMGHRVFLPEEHPWRTNKRSFNGKEEHRKAPPLLEGMKFLSHLDSMENFFGKTKKKNIVDSILGTLLDISGKTKDHLNARYDVQEIGIRKNPHPKEIRGHRKVKFAKACFSMTKVEKSIFCDVLKKAKLPDGAASNIFRCVNLAERKVSGYKTHDAHFMLHYLLQIPIKSFTYENSNFGFREHEADQQGTSWVKAKNYSQTFSSWFKARAMRQNVPDWIKELSRGPNKIEKRYPGYFINGYRFHTRQREARRKTQNSGVTLVALTTSFASAKDPNPIRAKVSYYGRINDIIELDYFGDEVDVNPQAIYEKEPSDQSMGPSIPNDNGEIDFIRGDLHEVVIDASKGVLLSQEYNIESEDNSEDDIE